MKELRDVRAVAEQALRDIYIEAFVYESAQPVGPFSVLQTSLARVEDSDVLTALFSETYGEITIQEFLHARRLGKPCFVDIRGENIPRDPRLEEFLKKEVYPPDLGVSYGFFENPVDLGKRLGRDVMAYLVEAYRQAKREVPVGLIAPVARLAWDVVDWYGAFGWKLVSEPKWEDRRTIDLQLKIDLNLPGVGKVFQESKIRAVSGLVDVTDARKFLQCCGSEKGEIISDLGIEPAAKRIIEGCGHVTAQTFDELLDQTVRIDDYLDLLEKDVVERGIVTGYVPLTCAEGNDNSDDAGRPIHTEQGAIDDYVDLWLQDWYKEHLSIIGEFGTGKTWCVLHLAWTAIRHYREAKKAGHPRPRIPIVVPLRDYSRAVSIESLFSEFFFREHNIGVPSYQAFMQLNRMGKLLLLFDGFDEMAARVDRQKMIDNFWEFTRVLVPGGKAILTCRTEHFPDAKEGRALLNAELQASTAGLTGVAPQFKVVELQKFNDRQLREVLSRRAKPDMIEKILANPDLMDMARRPLMVELILEALPEVESGAPVDLSSIYLYAVRRKMERDIKEERTFTSLADKLYFLCELSVEMLLTDQLSLNYRLFPDRLRRLFGEAVQEQKELDHWRFDMQGQAMLIRNDDGDYSPAHRSLVEFFSAYKFVAQLGVLAPEYTKLAQQQSYVDKHAAPRDYTWAQYFHRTMGENGRYKEIAPLRSFVLQEVEEFTPFNGDVPKPDTEAASFHLEGGDLINVDRLPRNALTFAAGMVSRDPLSLDKLCHLALEARGVVAWNAQSLLPLLKYPWSDVIATSLIRATGGQPMRSGVAWVFGELGVASQEVTEGLEKTVESLGKPNGASTAAWWESGFALEKLQVLGPREGRQGNRAIRYLIQSLPPGRTLEGALSSLSDSLKASERSKAVIDLCDIVTIVKHESLVDHEQFLGSVLALLDLGGDTLGRRCYYVVWLCGHLGIQGSIDSIIRAAEHPFGSVRNVACEALGKIGDASPKVVQILEKHLMNDKYYRTRYHAAWSLCELGSRASLPLLSRAIELEEVRDVREEMIRVRVCLEGVGEDPGPEQPHAK
jgi:hypothetical protein